MKNKLTTKLKTFTIVETLISILAISIMLVGPITFVSKSFKYASFTKDRIIAIALSQEGLELMTSLRNGSTDAEFVDIVTDADCGASVCSIDWNGSSDTPTLKTCVENSCALYTLSSDPKSSYRHGLGDTPTSFFREISIEDNGNEIYTVRSRVYKEVDSSDIPVEITLKKNISLFNK